MKNKLTSEAKVFILLISVLSVFNTANAQAVKQVNNSFSINGNISGLNKGTMILSYPMEKKIIQDSSTIENGHFSFKGSVPSPVGANLYVKDSRYQSLYFFLENSSILISGNKDSISVSKITGSLSNNDKDSIDLLLASYYDCLKALRTVSNFASKQQLTSVLHNVDMIYDELPHAQRKIAVDYALIHPDSYAITSRLFISFTNDQTELPLLKKVYNNFSASVKESQGGKEIAGLIKRIERIQIGNKAPDFTLPDTKGKEVKFSSFAGKYVLLDFWARLVCAMPG